MDHPSNSAMQLIVIHSTKHHFSEEQHRKEGDPEEGREVFLGDVLLEGGGEEGEEVVPNLPEGSLKRMKTHQKVGRYQVV